MATDKQIQANRNNAKKSTGPRSEEGKARSAQNALKHGLLARDAVLPGEHPAEFDQQFQALERAIQPDNAIEFEFLRQMADAQWRMRRLTRIETGFLAAALEEARTAAGGESQQLTGAEPAISPTRESQTGTQLEQPVDDCRPDHAADTLLLGRAMLGHTHALMNLGRYDGQLSRRFYRALDKLIELRAAQRRAREHWENYGPDPGERLRHAGFAPDFSSSYGGYSAAPPAAEEPAPRAPEATAPAPPPPAEPSPPPAPPESRAPRQVAPRVKPGRQKASGQRGDRAGSVPSPKPAKRERWLEAAERYPRVAATTPSPESR